MAMPLFCVCSCVLTRARPCVGDATQAYCCPALWSQENAWKRTRRNRAGQYWNPIACPQIQYTGHCRLLSLALLGPKSYRARSKGDPCDARRGGGKWARVPGLARSQNICMRSKFGRIRTLEPCRLPPPSGYYERQSFTASFTLILILVVVVPQVLRRASDCGKTTTNIRVNAAVNDCLLYRPPGRATLRATTRKKDPNFSSTNPAGRFKTKNAFYNRLDRETQTAPPHTLPPVSLWSRAVCQSII